MRTARAVSGHPASSRMVTGRLNARHFANNVVQRSHGRNAVMSWSFIAAPNPDPDYRPAALSKEREPDKDRAS